MAERLLVHDPIPAAHDDDGAGQLLCFDRLFDERADTLEPRDIETGRGQLRRAGLRVKVGGREAHR